MPNLNEQLRRRHLGQSAEVQAAYEAMVGELARGGFIDQVLAVGDHFPDMALPTAEGEMARLAEWWRRGPLVVTFFRGEWCPYCRLVLAALEAALPDIEALGASLIAVTPETGGRALAAKRRRGNRYEILSDVDCGLGLGCGVVFQAPVAYRALLRRFGHDLAERHGNDAWFLPVPATFILDREGVVRWRFAEADPTRRAEPADILAALRGLAAPAGG
ncbi:MAG: AhpC/TSA family protein [Acidisphaera sp.]|nr:AhpC/TSA family protein [Acidisphaera sp.]